MKSKKRMNKAKIIFGTYNNLPVGTAPHIFEEAYQNAYKPFLSTMYKYPEIPVTLHYSGTLLQWLDDTHSEFTDVLAEMTGRKQIEMVGGAFFNPILPLIPRPDRLGQIEKLTTYLRKKFGPRPRGAWLAEQVWEPSLVATLKNSGIEYIFLDDYHIFSLGLEKSSLFNPYLTEDQGKVINVFPLCHDLRVLTVKSSPQKIFDYIESHLDGRDEQIFVLMEAGEWFGFHGNNKQLTYAEGWLERFLENLKKNSDWIEPVHPLRYLKKYQPHRRLYFHSSTFEQMAGWNYRNGSSKSVIRWASKGQSKKINNSIGNRFFRNFLSEYPESNLLYSKMQYTHILVNQIRGDKYRKQAAREELWKGQCHDAYWHGFSHGLYSNHLRKEAYYALIEAEKVTREKGIFIPSIIALDFDMDGLTEYLYQGNELNCYIHTRGGMIFELDYLPNSWNYLDTLSRHDEPYHTPEIRREGYDHYMRKTFIDHFLNKGESMDRFMRMNYEEKGNFLDKIYTLVRFDRERKELVLSAQGMVTNGGLSIPIKLIKRYVFNRNVLSVHYKIKNLSEKTISTVFAPEINLSFASASSENLKISSSQGGKTKLFDKNSGTIKKTSEIFCEDLYNHNELKISSELDGGLWFFPLETYCLNDNTLIREYQATSFLLHFNVELAGEEIWENGISIKIDG